MPQSDPSKTERATDKRRKKARKKGNVPKSQETSKTAIVMAGLIGLYVWIDYIAKEVKGLMRWFIETSFHFDPTKQSIYDLFIFGTTEIAKMVMPILLFLAFVAYLIMRIQVGPLWTTEIFSPKFDKFLNPIGGLQRMFVSVNTLVRLGKNILMAAVIAIAPYIVIKGELANLAPLFYQNVEGVAVYMLETGGRMVLYAMLPMVVIAVADLVYTRWDYEENLKMTKDEVKDERKQMEGDPKIKQQQKQKMMGMMMKRMMADVPKADVVITNPTHFAVALKYDATEAPAPLVLAKGADAVALKIKEIAREHNIPIRENKPLARALYSTCEVGEMIPEELYQAVATILAQLFKFKGKRDG